jgi:organic hydroperoxide reductase OsmC/OhrA
MTYKARISWQKRSSEIFTDNKYSRAHTWIFDGGLEVPASASPHVVPLPLSDETAVDPEEAFVAAVSSCHMLFFLSLAAAQNYLVLTYEDNAEGEMTRNEEAKLYMSSITLHPSILFSDDRKPTDEVIAELHHASHEKCFIANSIKTVVHVAHS